MCVKQNLDFLKQQFSRLEGERVTKESEIEGRFLSLTNAHQLVLKELQELKRRGVESHVHGPSPPKHTIA